MEEKLDRIIELLESINDLLNEELRISTKLDTKKITKCITKDDMILDLDNINTDTK